MNIERNDLRNIAIVAHVDHGKTTLVDEMLKQAGAFRQNQHVAERVMDSGDIERERGITILAKNTALHLGHTKINVVDTPGHADFGGEVERVLKMVDGVLLLVDAFEGAMPQTRFVLQKALNLGHPVIIMVNKVDRDGARPYEVAQEALSLLIDLGADEAYLESPIVYASGRKGTASLSPDEQGANLLPLFDTILSHIPAPKGDPEAPLQVLISTLDYSDYLGRIAIGKVERGTIRKNQMVVRANLNGDPSVPSRIAGLFSFDGLKRAEAEEVAVGDIIALSGMENIMIGDTVCVPDAPEALPFVEISPPTLAVTFSVSLSPFAAKEGTYLTSRHIRDRLKKEAMTDVSLRIEETASADAFRVCGRGELHLTILMENMRRQGYSFEVSKPEVLTRDIDGQKMEPYERVTIDVPAESVGVVMEKLGSRKGVLTEMATGTRTRLTFTIPSRGLFGYRGEFMTDTRGEGLMASIFDSYQPWAGDISMRQTGALVAFEEGVATAYALDPIQQRGDLFVTPGTPVYAGMIVGRCSRNEDIDVNVCKKKHLTSMRADGKEDAIVLRPVRPMSLEEALEFIASDELVEITPAAVRTRKRILDTGERARSRRSKG